MATDWGGDCCFLPNPLPPDWVFPESLWPLLKDASNQLQLLEGIGRTLPNPAMLLRPLRDREAIRSSEIEGTFATPRQLLLLELDPKESESEHDPINQHREVLNYAQALDHATASDLPLCLRLIRDLHRILLSGVRGADRRPGEFRQLAVAIGATRKFVPPPAERLTEFLYPFEKYINAPQTPFDPLVDCFLAHYLFEAIHPFMDGNGRVGRLLLSLMIQQKCGLTKPWVHLSEYFEQHRREYYDGLYGISTRGDWETWIGYCLNGVATQARDTIARCEKLLATKETYRLRLQQVGGTIRLQQIVDGVFDVPFVRIADLPARLGVAYPTAKSDVQRLVAAGILEELSGVYPATFFAPELYAVAYDNLGE